MASSRLKALKQELISRCATTEVLLCPILQDVPTQPVVTPSGNIFNREEITNWINVHHDCPMTRNRLTLSDLMENEKLQLMAAIVTMQCTKLTRAINSMSLADEEKICDNITAYNELVSVTDREAAVEIERIRQTILINMLRLDINNAKHLEYWERQDKSRFDLYTHVKHNASGRKYFIPHVIYQLMLGSSYPYQSKAELKTALDKIRKQDTSRHRLFTNPFSRLAAHFRTATPGASICDIADIEQLRLT